MPSQNHDRFVARSPKFRWRGLLNRLGRPNPTEQAAHALYCVLVSQARTPIFYRELGVPDTPEGRFEMLALHVALMIRRLGLEGAAISQALFDLMVADLDVNLRELGVGDLSVGKQVKRLVGQFYARLGALDDQLAKGDAADLHPILRRNIYHGGHPPADDRLARLTRYIMGLAEQLAILRLDRLLDGDLRPIDLQSILELCHARQHNK